MSKTKSRQFTITVPENFYNTLEALTNDSGYSRSWIVREALMDFFKKYIDDKDLDVKN